MRWAKFSIPNPARAKLVEWTRLREKAAARAVARERETMALFPELRRVNSVADRKRQIDEFHVNFATSHRATRARFWREARTKLKGLPEGTRRGVLRLWQEASCPADPCYLLGMIRDAGRVSPWAKLRERRMLAERGRQWRRERGFETPDLASAGGGI